MRAALLALALLPLPAAAGDPPIPACSVDRVDHARPEKHLALSARVGDPAAIREIAAPLKAPTEEETLAAIHAWMGRNLRYDASKFDRWRDLAEIRRDGTYGGCADYAAVFGTLARACGIPCVWVKTMDAAWIRDFLAGRPEHRNYRGHVFLEVHVGKRWCLLEPGAPTLYTEYATSQRILPGERWAYDKGDDPYEVLLSVRWPEWVEQTERHFRGFDPSVLPVVGGARLFRPSYAVVILANSPEYDWIVKRVLALGVPRDDVFCTNADVPAWVRRARGRDLVIASVAGRNLLPPDLAAALLPPAEVRKAREANPAGVLRRTAADGTRVTLLYAPDAESLRPVVEGLELPR